MKKWTKKDYERDASKRVIKERRETKQDKVKTDPVLEWNFLKALSILKGKGR